MSTFSFLPQHSDLKLFPRFQFFISFFQFRNFFCTLNFYTIFPTSPRCVWLNIQQRLMRSVPSSKSSSHKKLSNLQLKSFLEKCTNMHIPEQTTLCQVNVPKLYTATIEEIRSCIAEHYIYVIVDETTDVCGNYIANILVGYLTHTQFFSTSNFLYYFSNLKIFHLYLPFYTTFPIYASQCAK